MKKNIKNAKVSIIIRVKNEEKWITSCLRAVFSQTYKNFEVILVDNNSSDNTIKKAKEFKVKILNINKFFPGKAINLGIKNSSGDIIVCLSGHCIPKNNSWLKTLIKNLNKSNVAGVYGRQEPLSFSSPNDKRDLILTFGLDKKIQKKDYFFHNANSAFQKTIWKKFTFNEKIKNIEDREWGKRVINNGLQIIYEPNASVYHYHGIHQNQKSERAISIANIMDEIEGISKNKLKNLNKSKISTIIPYNSNLTLPQAKTLLNYTLMEAENSQFNNKIFISTNNDNIKENIKSKSLKKIFLRPKFLKSDIVGIGDIIYNCLESIEKKFGEQDIIVVMDPSQPFRPKNTIDKMLLKLKKTHSDSIIAVYPEARNIFVTNKDNKISINESNFIPRHFKKNLNLISLFGLCFITYAKYIRENSYFGKNIAKYEIESNISNLQIRNKKDYSNLKKISKLINEK
ncbi:MAG: hypothetical protein CMI96_04185 [Pelagibacteraceae bacterium]|nr:hypothetical protein [Pelagibacteraceae bacterium]|tara:strand:- start:3593 stop:4963 length:1371 start_codon:yes stop_codon:yes gene_type:complete